MENLETSLGTLSVEKSGFTLEGYPGYAVTLKKDGMEVCVLLEVDETEDPPVCKVHIWDRVFKIIK